MPALTYRNFSGGEIDPAFYTSINDPRRQAGLKKGRNTTINKSGSASNRAGFEYMAGAPANDENARLIEFILDEDTTYILMLGDETLEVYQGSTLKDTVATPWLHEYLFDLQYIQSGNVITVASVTGTTNQNPLYEITRVSDTNWTVTEKSLVPTQVPPADLATSSITAGSNTYTYTMTAVDINGIESYAGTTTLVVVRHISIPKSDYGTNYTVRVYTLNAHGLSAGDRIYLTGLTQVERMTNHYYTVASSVDTRIVDLEVIAGDDIPTPSSHGIITGVTQSNPVVVTCAAGHSFSNTDTVWFYGCDMIELNETGGVISNVTATTFEVALIDSTAFTAGNEGFCSLDDSATAKLGAEGVSVSSAAAPTELDPHGLSATAATGAVEYNVYRKTDDGDVWGYIGSASIAAFADIGATPDTSKQPPHDGLKMLGTGDFPSAIGRYQQRLIVGNSENNIELLELSEAGDDSQFNTSSPIVAGSAFSFALNGRGSNAIKHILDVNGLVVMTSNGEWVIAGDANGSITPTTPNPKQGSYNGASKVRPLIVGQNALYVHNSNTVIRDLRFDFDSNGYAGIDLVEYAAHIFKDTTVKDWCYQKSPDSNVWVCMEDGRSAVLTYIPERKMVAWCTVDSLGGTIESLRAIPESGVDRVYAIVNRTVNGGTVRYLERMADRSVTDPVVDYKFLDSFITYDGRNTGATTLTITAITDYDAQATVTINTSAGYFVAGDVGKKLHFRTSSTEFDNDLGENVTTVTKTVLVIDAYTSTTEVTGHAESDIPTAHQATAVTDWGKAINVVTGLGTLEAEVVSCMADGNFVSGYDTDGDAVTDMTVTSGQITMTNDTFGEVIHTGLRYNSDIVTLDIDLPQGESGLNRMKRVNRAYLHIKESKDCHVGQDSDNLKKTIFTVSDDNSLDDGQLRATIPTRYDRTGSIMIRMQEAKPLTVTGIVIEGSIEGGQ